MPMIEPICNQLQRRRGQTLPGNSTRHAINRIQTLLAVVMAFCLMIAPLAPVLSAIPANAALISLYNRFVAGGAAQIETVGIDVMVSDVADSIGPGGVFPNIVTWLRADDGTAAGALWEDQTANGNDAIQGTASLQPIITASAINFNPGLAFDGNNDRMDLPSSLGMDGTSPYSVFYIATNDGPNNAPILSTNTTAVAAVNNKIQVMLSASGTVANSVAGGGGICAIATTDAVSVAGEPALGTVVRGTANRIMANLNGGTVVSGDCTVNYVAGNLSIGARWSGSTYTTFMNGYVSEIIVYDTELNEADIKKIESYLAVKYGITLGHDYVASDGTTLFWALGGGYDNDIAGIGRDDGSMLAQKQSKSINGDALLTIGAGGQIAATNQTNSAVLADLQFLAWGNNDGNAAWTAAGAPPTYNLLERQWQVQKTGTVGAVKIQLDVADADFDVPALSAGGIYYLVYDSNNNDDLSDETPVALTNSSGDLWETSTPVDFADGMEFTFATEVSTAPGITSGASMSIPENTTVVTTVTASGTAPITYSIVGGTDAGKFIIDENTGELSFIAAPDFENATDDNADGIYVVTLQAGNSAGTDTQTIHVTVADDPSDNGVSLPVRLFLGGAYGGSGTLMHDDLRANGLVPLTEPYSAAPYSTTFTHVGGGGETIAANVLAITGSDAIVDWVFLELRDSISNVVATRSALVQRDGDVVDVDGVSAVSVSVAPGNYYIVARHRNHLSVMTANTVALSTSSALVDFSTGSGTYGGDGLAAQQAFGTAFALQAGDTSGDGRVTFALDVATVRNTIINAVDNITSTLNYTGVTHVYDRSDVNLDGRVQVSLSGGRGSDSAIINNVLVQHPGNGQGFLNYVLNGTVLNATVAKVQATQGIEFNIRSNGSTYEIYMRPNFTPVTSQRFALTSQITIRSPHSSTSGQAFSISNLQSNTPGWVWDAQPLVSAPIENSSHDYVTFILTDNISPGAVTWSAGQEVLIFTFENQGACLGAIELIDNNTDPYITNPTLDVQNVITLSNPDGDPIQRYLGNYKTGQAVCVVVDSDNDGLTNEQEAALGTNPNSKDSDGDGIEDAIEVGDVNNPPNTDSDSLIDALDHDDDGDGILTADEAPDPNGDGDSVDAQDTDGDGTPDYLDLDSDNDGIPDQAENANAPESGDTDGDGVIDRLDLDSDNDGINDVDEAGPDGTDTDPDGLADGPYGANGLADGVETTPESGQIDYTVADSDRDDVPDYLDLDSDNDTLCDLIEGGGGTLDADNNGVADGSDRDGDGIVDNADTNDGGDGNGNDFGDGASPALPDSDNDGIPNFREVDSNDDGTFDIADMGLDLLDPDGDGSIDDTADDDGDGIPNAVDTQDTVFGGLPNPTKDTDGDGIPDIKEGDPALDTDGDGKPNYRDPDDDGDGISTAGEDLNDNLNWLDDDADGDGIPAYLDPNDGQPGVGDGDDDGISDDDECPMLPCRDSDGDNIPDYIDPDDDNDGVLTKNEDSNGDGDPTNDDAGGDGTPDYLDFDTDGSVRTLAGDYFLPIIYQEAGQ